MTAVKTPEGMTMVRACTIIAFGSVVAEAIRCIINIIDRWNVRQKLKIVAPFARIVRMWITDETYALCEEEIV